MNVLDEKFKSFAFSSISENEDYKKIYIISIYESNNGIKENIPYIHNIFKLKKN